MPELKRNSGSVRPRRAHRPEAARSDSRGRCQHTTADGRPTPMAGTLSSAHRGGPSTLCAHRLPQRKPSPKGRVPGRVSRLLAPCSALYRVRNPARDSRV